MCCCFGRRGEYVEPAKKTPQRQIEEMRKPNESNSQRSSVPRELYPKSDMYSKSDPLRDRSRDHSRGSSTSRDGNRGSQSGYSSSGDSRGINSDTGSHRHRNSGYGQEGYTQGVRSQPSLGTRALGSGLNTSRYTPGDNEHRR
ncbi:hypothetical protein EAE96_009421 [Botrytis aclada]|nr:hypothetical protein EAE96_009421 [Botrytis aclada]